VRTSFEQFCDRLRAIGKHHWVAYLAVILTISWRLLSQSPADPDLFARIAMGRLVQTSGSVPLTDPFAFTPKLPHWIDHEWLSGVVFWQIIQNTGEAGLILAKLVIAALTMLFILRASTMNTPFATGRFIWITICMLHASFLWGTTLRCQAFTYLFLSFFLFAAESCRKRGTLLYLFPLPLISIGWINLHGGWALGICTMWLYAIANLLSRNSRGKRALIISAAVCSLAPFLTPYGASEFLGYLINALRIDRPSIEEWAPLIHDHDAFAVAAGISVLLVVGALARRERDLVGLSIVLFSAYCGFRHIRLLGFFMIACAVYGAPLVDAIIVQTARRYQPFLEKLSRAISLTAAIFIVFIGYDSIRHALQPSAWKLDLGAYSYEALKWLSTSGEQGRLLVDFNNGSLALWMLYPNFQISVDGRYEEVYPSSTVRDNALALQFGTEEGERAREAINPTHMLASPSVQSSLPTGWNPIYSDSRAVILRRNEMVGSASDRRTPSTTRGLWEPDF
jgi:hypothetical protein